MFIFPGWELLLNLKILFNIEKGSTGFYPLPYQKNMLLALIPKKGKTEGREKGKMQNDMTDSWQSPDKKEEKTTGGYQSKSTGPYPGANSVISQSTEEFPILTNLYTFKEIFS